MNILDKIALHKRKEVEIKRERIPFSSMERAPLFTRNCLSLCASLTDSKTGVIAEFKRRSPSKQALNLEATVKQIVPAYQKAGAAGISVLTDEKFFGGSNEDLFQTRQLVNLPILRKDFVVSEFQIVEAKAIGADVILLIAALISSEEIKHFAQMAKSLGLEVLLEVHNEKELQENLLPEVDLVGVNNRNLKTFEVDLNISRSLSDKIPSQFLKISESGISEATSVLNLRSYGYRGFLMGENFMKTSDPGMAATEFIKSLEG